MKILKKAIAAAVALTLCLSLGFSALADGDDDALYAGKTWEEVVDRVLEECDVSRDHITAGYCNLVTGEEHYINGDEYKTAASMYKLPLNMYFTDLIQSGQFDWDSYYPNVTYEYVRDASLIYSDNDWSMFLWSSSVIGGYSKFRELTAPYMGVDLNDVPDNYYSDNIYTARQFINCLKLLYNEQDRFPGIIETMQQTEQERFFMLREPRFKIAHKYGYISENGHSFMNDCGLAFTSQPIALVMFTDNVDNAEELLTAYCTAVCEYTNYTVANPPATPTPEPTAEPTPTVPAVTASAEPTPVPATPEPEPAKTATPFAAFLFIALFLAGGVTGAIKLKKKYNASLTLTLIAVLLCAAVCALISMNDMAAPSVSLEGKSLWLAQSLPVTAWQVLRAKLRMHLLLTAVPGAVLGVCLVAVCDFPAAQMAAVLALAAVFLVFSALLNLFLGLKMPNLHWTSEITPIKQSGAVAIALLGGWAYAAAMAVLYFLVGRHMGFAAYMAAFLALTLAAAVLLYIWVRKKGCAIFASL